MKKINAICSALFIMCLLLASISVMAQTSTTGTIEGTVSDTNGAVIPNATVIVSGGSLLRPQTTTSDNNGNYRFFQIPPGKYQIKVESSAGFDSFEQNNVEVNLSKSTNVSITLKPKGVGATVDVVASSPEIDTTNNISGTNVSTEFFSNIPTSRTVQGLYTIAPTVARSGLRDVNGKDRDPSVAGSSGPENNYILDGVNTTDPAFGGGGSNIPFEFVQEVEIKTGAYGADQGLSTGGVFNVITKSGTNEFHGDVFAFIGNKNLVRETKNFPLVGLAPNGFSEIDAGVALGGPIIKNRLTFFAAFNPQYRTNFSLTQTFRAPVETKVTTPFYSGKATWLVNTKNTFTFSTFGDFTKVDGHLGNFAGFGSDLRAFRGVQELGGTNYAFRLNSNLAQNWIGEFSFGIHRQRNNINPESDLNVSLVVNNFAILKADGTVANVTQSGIAGPTNTGFVDYVYSPNGLLQRNFTVGEGYGVVTAQSRNRWEAAARLQTIWEKHTIKYGFEFYRNSYDINSFRTGPDNTFANPLGVPSNTNTPNENSVSGFNVTNNFSVCTTRGAQIVCPSAAAVGVLNALPVANLPTGITSVINGTITAAEALNNPFLVRLSTTVRDFQLNAQTETDNEAFYIQDDWRVHRNLQINIGARWDYQQSRGNNGESYLKLNNWFDNLQPRIGWIWDFTGQGKGKIFMNYARFVETPIPLDVNVRAGSNDSQTDKNFRVNRLNAPLNATITTGFNLRNLGAHPTPIDQGLKPQTVNEVSAGFEYEVKKDFALGVRGIYRAQGSVIEDGSFDDGDNYFLFNPGEIRPGDNTTEELACNNPAIGCFGRARRYYRGLEFTLNKRFSNNYSFVSSYVFSSLIGNYEGLFRNDNGQADPNITSLFDLVSLLNNTYGRLPNDRPHQFKFNGTYQTPFKLMVSGNFFVQSGTPFNQLIPHFLYGNNEGFGVPRGTAIIPNLGAGSAGVESAIGKSRTPTTWNLDLGFYYPIKISETKQIRLMADWFNVTNAQRAVVLDQTFQINSGIAGVAPVSNPTYGSGTIFQFPSNFRFGAKFTF
jgi:outer membrane receptor protein involved in Fe transport